MPVVAIYDTFGDDIVEYIINHAELKSNICNNNNNYYYNILVIVCSNWKETTSKIVRILEKLKTVQYIIQMETITDEQVIYFCIIKKF